MRLVHSWIGENLSDNLRKGRLVRGWPFGHRDSGNREKKADQQ
jgi:hypothetical protein